jgi:hypothetical protein
MRHDRWLRCLLLAALAAAGTARAGRAQERPQEFRETNTEILAMGLPKWLDLHGGGSLADSEALWAYRNALKWRNDRLMARVSPDLRRRIQRLRPLLVRYAQDMYEISLYEAGGGTIWSGVHGEALVDSEETLYALLGGRVEPARPLVVSAVTKVLDELQADVDGPPDPDVPLDPQSARAALASARATFRRILKIAATLDRKGSDQILAFCADYPVTMGEDGPTPLRVPDTPPPPLR